MKKIYKVLLLILALFIVLALGCSIHAEAEAPDNNDKIPEVLERIGMCESENNGLARNPHSSAKGRFQFLDSSWKYYGNMLWGDDLASKDVLDYWDNTQLAVFVYNLHGTVDWNASKSCWEYA